MFKELEAQLKSLPEGEPCPAEVIREYVKLLRSGSFSEEDVPVFADRCPTLLKMITSGVDLSILDTFLYKLDKVKEGKQEMKEAEKDLASVLNETYVKPKLKASGL